MTASQLSPETNNSPGETKGWVPPVRSVAHLRVIGVVDFAFRGEASLSRCICASASGIDISREKSK